MASNAGSLISGPAQDLVVMADTAAWAPWPPTGEGGGEMKRRVLAVVAAAEVSVSLASGTMAQGAGQPDENANCIGIAQATEHNAESQSLRL